MKDRQVERQEPQDPKLVFSVYAIKCQFEYGEDGDDIVRMVTQYIEQGWMSWEEGVFCLKGIFKPTPDDMPLK